jgi:hypothetical protein
MASVIKKSLKFIIEDLYHDIYGRNPRRSWHVLGKLIKSNYPKIRPTLLQWQEKGYITLIEDDATIFMVHPDKLPSKEELLKSID